MWGFTGLSIIAVPATIALPPLGFWIGVGAAVLLVIAAAGYNNM